MILLINRKKMANPILGFLIAEGIYLGSLSICVITTYVKGRFMDDETKDENYWTWTNETNDPSQTFQHYILGFGFLAMFFLLHSGKHKVQVDIKSKSRCSSM